MTDQSMLNKVLNGNLVLQIAAGILLAVGLAWVSPPAAASVGLLGSLFVSALKAVAPILVLVLVASAIANRQSSHSAQMRPILLMYFMGTVAAALVAVTISKLFPTVLSLDASADIVAPKGITEVLNAMLFKIVDNPINALLNGNYIGILVWGVMLGLFLHHASEATRQLLADLATAITSIVKLVIRAMHSGTSACCATLQYLSDLVIHTDCVKTVNRFRFLKGES